MNWYDLIRDDVDEAIEKSDTFECFLTFLEKRAIRSAPGNTCPCARTEKSGQSEAPDWERNIGLMKSE